MKTTAKTPQILKFTTGHWTSGARSSRFGYVNGCNRLKDPVHSRPDIAIKVAACLQKGITSATVETFQHRVLREAQSFADTSVIVRLLPMQEVFCEFRRCHFCVSQATVCSTGVIPYGLYPKPCTKRDNRVFYSRLALKANRSSGEINPSAEAYSMSS